VFTTCQVAEASPYYEAFKRASVEVIFCYQEHDEIVLGNLGKYKDKQLKSIEVRPSAFLPRRFCARLFACFKLREWSGRLTGT
jgi:hypothetical protein